MQARTLNPKAVVAAAMMMMAAVAVAPASAHPGGHAVETRTLMRYYEGAWLAPTAVVLKSAAAWDAWNQSMVAHGEALATEAVPTGVDWSREAVLVVTLGLRPDGRMMLDLASASVGRAGGTDVELSLVTGQGGSAPCLVLAMPRQLAGSVELVNGAALGLPSVAPEYSPAPLVSTNGANGGAVAATWGEMKDAYRR